MTTEINEKIYLDISSCIAQIFRGTFPPMFVSIGGNELAVKRAMSDLDINVKFGDKAIHLDLISSQEFLMFWQGAEPIALTAFQSVMTPIGVTLSVYCRAVPPQPKTP